MTWSNVKLILFRELRDQLRDRRTLFVIAVLPILLYPLLWMSFLQVAQFMREKPSKVLIVGARNLADLPSLAEHSPFASRPIDASVEPLPGGAGGRIIGPCPAYCTSSMRRPAATAWTSCGCS